MNVLDGDTHFLAADLLHPFSNDEDLVQAIKELSEIFNQRGPKLQSYGEDARLVSAYAQFYLPTHWPKIEFLFSRLPEIVRNELSTLPLIDWGSGPATFSLWWAKFFPNCASMMAIEKAQAMRDQAQKFATAEKLSLKIYSSLPEIFPKDSVLLFGHSLNEMDSQVAQALVKKINPLYIIALEPSFSDSWKKMMTFRTYILQKKFQQIYPCPSASGSCPISASDHVCQQVVRVQLPFWLEQLSQKCLINRRDQNMLAHLWRREAHPSMAWPQGRLVHSYAPQKHGMNYRICHGSEHGLQIMEAQELKRGLDREAYNRRLDLTSGDPLEWEQADKGRIKLKI